MAWLNMKETDPDKQSALIRAYYLELSRGSSTADLGDQIAAAFGKTTEQVGNTLTSVMKDYRVTTKDLLHMFWAHEWLWDTAAVHLRKA